MGDPAPNEAGVQAEQPQEVKESNGAGVHAAQPQVTATVQQPAIPQVSMANYQVPPPANLVSNPKNGHDG